MGSTLLVDTGAPGGADLELPPPPDDVGPGGDAPGGDTPGGHGGHGGGGRRKAIAVLAAGALLAGGLGAGLSLVGSPTGRQGSSTAARTVVIPSVTTALAAPVRSVEEIVTATSPAVVRIVVSEASPSSEGPLAASGTGIILTSSGEILTNHHVVEGSTGVRVTIVGHGTYEATVLGTNPSADVALLQIQGYEGRLPTVRLGNASTVAVGDAVVAIGYAYGLEHASVATGSVTGLDRTATASDGGIATSTETLHGLVQVRADIVSGDSGGPLLNSRGQVVGINTMGATNGGTGFAIPVNTAARVANEIVAGQGGDGVRLGQSAYLGVFTTDASTMAGVAVYDVAIGGPAARAGIAAGDTITAVDGVATASTSALEQAVSAHHPGDSVQVHYLDPSGTSHTVTLRLGAINP